MENGQKDVGTAAANATVNVRAAPGHRASLGMCLPVGTLLTGLSPFL